MLNNQKPILLQDLGMLYQTEQSKQKKRYGIYECKCGIEFKANSYRINSGKTKSCGCMVIAPNKTHGLRKHKLYSIWKGIKSRVYNKNRINFKDYGGRGITVCDEWRNDFNIFYIFCIENGWDECLEIDRIDNNGNYEPLNCRFVSRSVNVRNTRLIRSNNTSGYRGVYFDNKIRKWIAQIGIGGIQKKLGSFNSAIEAAISYDNYVINNNLEHTINRAG